MVDYIQYFGNLTLEISLDGVNCLFDINTQEKLYGEVRRVKSYFDPLAAKRCDIIFVTDERAECCEPETIKRVAERTYATVIGPKYAIEKIDLPSKNKIEVKEGERFVLKGIDIQVVRSSQPRATYAVGYVISSPKYRIYFSGQTYNFSTISQIKCDIAILPIKGTHMIDYFDAAEICKIIRPKFVMPIAFENLPDAMQQLKEFKNSLPEYTKPIIVQPGQIAKLP
jgi:L-ascorbate metabolism protein UlaG (beta-lactamase superfamily)